MNDKAAKFKEELIDLLRKHSVEIHTKGQVDVYLGEGQAWKMSIIYQDVRLEPGTRYGRIP